MGGGLLLDGCLSRNCGLCCNQTSNDEKEGPLNSEVAKLKKTKTHVLVCKHKTCARQGAKETARELKRALKRENLRDEVLITKVKCLDQCGSGPVVVVYPEGVWYGGVDGGRAREIVERHIARGERAGGEVLHDMRALKGEER